MNREWAITENGHSGLSGSVPDRMTDKPSPHEIALAKLLIDRKRAESMLAMLKGNTEPDDIEKLRRAWLQPILDRLLDLRLQIDKGNMAELSSDAVGNSQCDGLPLRPSGKLRGV